MPVAGHTITNHCNINSSRVVNSANGGTTSATKEVICDTVITMCTDNGKIVSGVNLVEKRNLSKSFSCTSEVRQLNLGAVILDENPSKIPASQLRRVMCSQLPSLPASFGFYTREGWPLRRDQERVVRVSHLINERSLILIYRHFDRLPVGVMISGGECLGLIFADLNWTVRKVRDVLDELLKEIHKSIRFQYIFLEYHGWPLSLRQEPLLTLVDILVGQDIYIKYDGFSSQSVSPLSFVSFSHSDDRSTTTGQDTIDSGSVSSVRGRLKIGKSKEADQKTVSDKFSVDVDPKPILISYVRAEAAEYALVLKEELATLGFSVYLDVHEIKTGTDWQDALNHAVRNCSVFVPLITSMYGKTQWTNREIKLADMLRKAIIPVNFVDTWPPECLAIQFATTQYIPWKVPENAHEKGELESKSSVSKSWDDANMRRVSREIAEHCKTVLKVRLRRRISSKSKKRPVSTPVTLSIDEFPSTQLSSISESPEKKDRQFIVICVHPKQKNIADQLRTLFEEDELEVWCSIDGLELVEETFESDGFLPSTPQDLISIPEEKISCRDENYFNRKISGSSSQTESVSKGRVPLFRVMSNMVDISPSCFVSPERMEWLKTFQQKVDQSGVVVVIVSEDYTRSRISQQQIFYIEHRKQIVLVKADNSQVPKWFTMLTGNDVITNIGSEQSITALKTRVKRALNPDTSVTPKDGTVEAKMNYLVKFLTKNTPQLDNCVFVTGSSKLRNHRTEEICRAIGRELAKVKDLQVVTGGSLGAPDIIAKTFFDAKENNLISTSNQSAVQHVLPMRDSEVSPTARQNYDGSFDAVPYGKTLFLGDSLKERDTAVARMLDTCIVVEGGPNAAHIVTEFLWNDHFVIPVFSTGGAAGGQFGVPVNLFENPPAVSEADWTVLSDKEATPDDVARAVVNIVGSLKRSIASHSKTPEKPSRNKNKLKSKSRKTRESQRKKLIMQEQVTEIESLRIPKRHNSEEPLSGWTTNSVHKGKMFRLPAFLKKLHNAKTQ
ncbi:uncharacterized protein LOC143257345 isoform X1 [Tachypleus tridentatus]|uniref:uncharacterized protein LOC143257345 isoform X1 n=2 Tax=Tachypleus tridentatus TaxID=6853 RepID=UPI003FD1F1D8